MSVSDMSKVIVITGPTASGKTSLGIRLAQEIGGEIVSADSMQVYKHMDIGTSKPTEKEMLGIPHYMIDILSPQETCSVARYVEDATAHIGDIMGRGKQPILVGGSGLYIDSLLLGYGFLSQGNSDVREMLEADYDSLGGNAMLGKLREFDPESADRLSPNDKKRIVRAIEVYKTTGKTISAHNIESKIAPPRYESAKYALSFLNRADLYDRIDKRVDTMVANGLENEVRKLLEMKVDVNSTAMQAIGYKEMVVAINDNCSIDDAIEKIKMESRRYAKRQLTWLRRDERITWITWDNEPDFDLALNTILRNA